MKRIPYLSFFFFGVFLLGIGLLAQNNNSKKNEVLEYFKSINRNIFKKEAKVSSVLTNPSLNMSAKSDEILVKFRKGIGSFAKSNIVGSFSGKMIGSEISNSDFSLVSIEKNISLQDAIREYSNHPDIEFAQPNYIYRATVAPSDPQFVNQWGFRNTGQTIFSANYLGNNPGISGKDMNMVEAWDNFTKYCDGVPVAVLDSGANYNHEDLTFWNSSSCVSDLGGYIGNCPYGYDFVDNDIYPMDLNGHGTHVSGIIGAKMNGLGGVGVCWGAPIMAVRVLDDTGIGTTEKIIKGINFAVKNGAKIINLSLSGTESDTALQQAIALAGKNHDALFVVAAGNESEDLRSGNSYPCKFPESNIVCVGALDQSYSLAQFSNYDTSKTHVDVSAPGTNIVNTWAGMEVDVLASSEFSDWTYINNSGTPFTYLTCYIALDGGPSLPYTTLLLPNNCNTPLVGNVNGAYANLTHSQVYKSVTISSAVDRVYAEMALTVDTLDPYDTLSFYYGYVTNPPFNITYGKMLKQISEEMNGRIEILTLELKDCVGRSRCTLGMEFNSGTQIGKSGVAILGLSMTTMDKDYTNRYKAISGTSMAAPHVAGLAALLRYKNPKYSAEDTIQVLLNGGKTVTGLENKTRSGKAVDAVGAFKYLFPPENIVVTVP
ncbi:S8 family serine peptidase [Leptospira andrefontaineae]|nr:S8 family serine peptidase [Leptospira andrefontaineae]